MLFGCRALSNVADEGLLKEGWFWIPSLAGPSSLASRASVSPSRLSLQLEHTTASVPASCPLATAALFARADLWFVDGSVSNNEE